MVFIASSDLNVTETLPSGPLTHQYGISHSATYTSTAISDCQYLARTYSDEPEVGNARVTGFSQDITMVACTLSNVVYSASGTMETLYATGMSISSQEQSCIYSNVSHLSNYNISGGGGGRRWSGMTFTGYVMDDATANDLLYQVNGALFATGEARGMTFGALATSWTGGNYTNVVFRSDYFIGVERGNTFDMKIPAENPFQLKGGIYKNFNFLGEGTDKTIVQGSFNLENSTFCSSSWITSGNSTFSYLELSAEGANFVECNFDIPPRNGVWYFPTFNPDVLVNITFLEAEIPSAVQMTDDILICNVSDENGAVVNVGNCTTEEINWYTLCDIELIPSPVPAPVPAPVPVPASVPVPAPVPVPVTVPVPVPIPVPVPVPAPTPVPVLDPMPTPPPAPSPFLPQCTVTTTLTPSSFPSCEITVLDSDRLYFSATNRLNLLCSEIGAQAEIEWFLQEENQNDYCIACSSTRSPTCPESYMTTCTPDVISLDVPYIDKSFSFLNVLRVFTFGDVVSEVESCISIERTPVLLATLQGVVFSWTKGIYIFFCELGEIGR